MADSVAIPAIGDPIDRGLFADVPDANNSAAHKPYRKPAKSDHRTKPNHHRRREPIDPEAGAGASSPDSRASSRASSPGSSSGKRATSTRTPAQKRETLEALMWTIHTSFAAIAKAPELAIEPKEAAKLVTAWEHLADAYGVPEISEKAAAVIEVIGVSGAVYIPRL